MQTNYTGKERREAHPVNLAVIHLKDGTRAIGKERRACPIQDAARALLARNVRPGELDEITRIITEERDNWIKGCEPWLVLDAILQLLRLTTKQEQNK